MISLLCDMVNYVIIELIIDWKLLIEKKSTINFVFFNMICSNIRCAWMNLNIECAEIHYVPISIEWIFFRFTLLLVWFFTPLYLLCFIINRSSQRENISMIYCLCLETGNVMFPNGSRCIDEVLFQAEG